MLDDAEPKTTLTQKAPTPLVTMMSDGSVRLDADDVPILTVQNLLLTAAAAIAVRAVQRAAAIERVLATIRDRFDGFDPATARAMDEVLGPPAPAPPPANGVEA